MYQRQIVTLLKGHLTEFEAHIQVIVGPRQVGKTTAATQIADALGWPTVFETADLPLAPGAEWIETQWARTKQLIRGHQPVLLVLDEIQKISGWSEVIKRLWDTDNPHRQIRLLLLGSSALLLKKGVTESLAGRFFLHRLTHWSFLECQAAFGWTLNQWIYFGGYPGAVHYLSDETLWKQYVRDSLIETVLSKDVFDVGTIRKPALLRQLFMLCTAYPAQILSYTNMLGQLQDAGNTTTLSDYLTILGHSFLISGLESFSKREIKKRGSSPKLIVWNNAIISAISLGTFQTVLADTTEWGRRVENAVGGHLLNQLSSGGWDITYWRNKQKYEVDFVVSHGHHIWGLEVKSGSSAPTIGLTKFKEHYPESKQLIIGGPGIPLETFFETPLTDWLS